MKIKIEIKNRWTGKVLFEFEKEDNTVKKTLEEAVEQGADLRDADLRGAYLRFADLRFAYLRVADLRGAYLGGADLGGAYLRGAYLRGAYLGGAYLGGAKNIPFVPMSCPSDGSFTGWKKVYGKLIELEIPADARRSSATGTKCRCDKAKVVSITDIGTSEKVDKVINRDYSPEVTYEVGKMVYPDSFDEYRWCEFSHGIHFFINKQEAIEY